ncbi:peptidylprolyl isomerase [Desertifilum tharense IPPAS B-1220]|uniref:peptidylprolyl isomerase n=1 Tax=Desertifilum tharense IPPAS B-1220 TaxID=1781255 RepID=A0A1E5QGQ7_9CYAN|nr:peptidylprolyl isomerase [Desertifilum tharense]OEJ73781.1 peptidylprolyl isomerase [Desertifilum tharense IPPAS B-1220]
MSNLLQRLLRTSFLAILLCILSVGLSAAWWDLGDSGQPQRQSRLPAGDAITDGKALLRYALPIDNEPVRQMQSSIEDIATQLRGRRWTPIRSDISQVNRILNRPEELLASIPEANQAQARSLLEQLQTEISTIDEALEAKDREQIWTSRSTLLDLVGQLEESMVTGFPYEVPEDYSNLPQLKGRATIEFETTQGNITAVVDGYSAPVTAGNFVDLVQRGFYDGLEFTRAEDFYVLQIGDPPGPEDGFVDPKTGEYRRVPLEVFVRSEEKPIYGITLEDAGLYREQPVLPFSAYGTLAMARPDIDPNGGSSQFFFFLFEPELTPAGLNLLDGRYSVFGYVVENKEVLGKIKQGDKIISAQVVQGAENLVQPSAS